MELTRRDALAALSAAGVGSVAGCSAPTATGDSEGNSESDDRQSSVASPVSDHELETLTSVAKVVYPSAVSGVGDFVRTYTGGRIDDDGDYAAGVADAVADLDDYARKFYGGTFATRSRDARAEALRYMSVDVADPDPDGTDAQRVRHFVVNELLYAFYTSPTGASLAGLENPPGHPGGIDSYREGPEE